MIVLRREKDKYVLLLHKKIRKDRKWAVTAVFHKICLPQWTGQFPSWDENHSGWYVLELGILNFCLSVRAAVLKVWFLRSHRGLWGQNYLYNNPKMLLPPFQPLFPHKWSFFWRLHGLSLETEWKMYNNATFLTILFCSENFIFYKSVTSVNV